MVTSVNPFRLGLFKWHTLKKSLGGMWGQLETSSSLLWLAVECGEGNTGFKVSSPRREVNVWAGRSLWLLGSLASVNSTNRNSRLPSVGKYWLEGKRYEVESKRIVETKMATGCQLPVRGRRGEKEKHPRHFQAASLSPQQQCKREFCSLEGL